MLVLTFIFPNIINLLISMIIAVMYDVRRYLNYIIFSLALFIASINAGKSLESDLLQYAILFEGMASISLSDAIGRSVEPIFSIWNWFLNRLIGVDTEGFVFLSSLSTYMLLMLSYKRYFSFPNINIVSFLLSISLLIFFPLVFAQSAHLLRQYLAGAIALYALSRNSSYVMFFLLVTATLIHVSSVVFMVAPIAMFMSKSIKIFYANILIIPISSIVVLRLFSPFLLELSLPAPIIYGIARMSQSTFYELNSLGVISLSLLVVGLLFALSVIFDTSDQKKSDPVIHYFNALYIVISVFSIFTNYHGFAELAQRFAQYCFLLLPPILVYASRRNTLLLLTTLSIFAVFVFGFLALENPWTYKHPLEYLLYPPVSHLLTS